MSWRLRCTGAALQSAPQVRHSALRNARVPVIGSPINYANRLIGSPITSQSTGEAAVLLYIKHHALFCFSLRFICHTRTAARNEQLLSQCATRHCPSDAQNCLRMSQVSALPVPCVSASNRRLRIKAHTTLG